MAPDDNDPHERPTLEQCPVCEGHFRTFETDGRPAPKGTSHTLRVNHCAVCTEGMVTAEQMAAYRARPKRASGEIPVPPEANLSVGVCVICSLPIMKPSQLASAVRGFRHVGCVEEEI